MAARVGLNSVVGRRMREAFYQLILQPAGHRIHQQSGFHFDFRRVGDFVIEKPGNNSASRSVVAHNTALAQVCAVQD